MLTSLKPVKYGGHETTAFSPAVVCGQHIIESQNGGHIKPEKGKNYIAESFIYLFIFFKGVFQNV